MGSAGLLGRVSRRLRYSSPPASLLARASGRAVRNLASRLGSSPLGYTDACGFERRADLKDHQELEAFLGLGRLPDLVLAAVAPGDWVIDAGANVGIVTAQLCRRVGAGGHVWAIVPVPRNIARLTELAGRNRLSQLEVLEGGLSDSTGEAEIGLPVDGSSGWASFTKSWDIGDRFPTRTWRLDDLVAERGSPGRLSFVKIDVEGCEPRLLEGATKTLAAFRPLVMCEFNDHLLRDAGSSSAELLAAFSGLGYRPAGGAPEPATLAGQVLD
ncbi:MAG: FkbM family methyltransferase, partial [Candidatus Dormibacterales bacterium]